jgi:hypothetical protein
VELAYGSSAGITALEENTTDDGDYCIDYVRSDRAPVSTAPSTITFVAMAGDATTWPSPEGGGVTSPVPSMLTLTDRRAATLRERLAASTGRLR